MIELPVVEVPVINGAVVQLWRARLDVLATSSADDASLSEDERRRAAAFVHDIDRRRFVLGHTFVRDVLARYCGCSPLQIEFEFGVHGKPLLGGRGARSPLAFNVAHSDSMVVVACASSATVGVDIEPRREVSEWRDIAARVLSPTERAVVDLAPVDERPAEFLRCWTRKEALLKALGVGLSDDAVAHDATTFDSGPVVVDGVEYAVVEFAPDAHHLGALAVANSSSA